jgi:hypothetical protein
MLTGRPLRTEVLNRLVTAFFRWAVEKYREGCYGTIFAWPADSGHLQKGSFPLENPANRFRCMGLTRTEHSPDKNLIPHKHLVH